MTTVPSPPLLNSADRAQEPGFKTLFDGGETASEVFATWCMVGEGSFSLCDRCLVAEPGDEIGLLYYTAEQFDDFVLRLDFLLPRPFGEHNDNSGVYVRFRDPLVPLLPGTLRTEYSTNPATGPVDTGYEIQIDEESRGDSRKDEADGLFYNHTGAVYKIPHLGKGPGQQDFTNQQRLQAFTWHSYEISVHDRTYTVLLNGQHATTFTADARAPGETFRGRKKREDAASGFIGLQAHTGNVAFANVRIKAL